MLEEQFHSWLQINERSTWAIWEIVPKSNSNFAAVLQTIIPLKKTAKHYWENYNIEKSASHFSYGKDKIKIGEIKEKRKGKIDIIENLYLVWTWSTWTILGTLF